MREEKRQAEQDAKDVREGKIYLNDYGRYTKDDVKNICDIAFLTSLACAITPAGQPADEWEYQQLWDMWNCIHVRISELKK